MRLISFYFLRVQKEIFVIVLLSFLFCSFSVFTFQAIAQEIVWTEKESMSIPRTEFGVAEVENKLYVIGGYCGSLLSMVDEYNTLTGVWTRKTDMPTPRRLHAVVAVNGKVYAIGGWNYIVSTCSGQFCYATEEYDPQTDTWTIKADFPMPHPPNSCIGNAYIGGGSANGKIYIFIFNTNISGTVATFEYDPINDSWDTDKSPVPFNYTRFAVASLNDKIYVLGSGDDGVPLAEYDALNDIWIIRPSTSTNRSLLGLAATNSGLYAIGGWEGDYPSQFVSSTIERFDFLTNSWELVTPMPTPRFSMGVSTASDKIYVLGGEDTFSIPLSVVEEGVAQSPHEIQANAGPDQIVFSGITLDGSQSYNPVGTIESYEWQIRYRGDPAYDRTASGVNPTITDLEPGFYDVILTVTAGESTDEDEMEFSAIGVKGDLDLDGDVDGWDLSDFSEEYGK